MRFVIDAQLPPGLATRLRERGHDARHVNELGMGYEPDQAIAETAKGLDAVLVSKDLDFFELHNRSALGCRLLWIRLGNVSNSDLWRVVESNLETIVARFAGGDTIIEISD